MTSKIEEYRNKAAASLAARDAATSQKDRAHHGRAHGIYRKLIDGAGAADARAAARDAAQPAKKSSIKA